MLTAYSVEITNEHSKNVWTKGIDDFKLHANHKVWITTTPTNYKWLEFLFDAYKFRTTTNWHTEQI